MQHKAFGGAIGPLGEPESVKGREHGFNAAVAFVELLFTCGWGKLIASARGHKVNCVRGKFGFEGAAEVALIRREMV